MVDYFKLAISKYAEFTGRSRRSEYWYFALAVSLLFFAGAILAGIMAAVSETLGLIVYVLLGIAYLGIIIPSIALVVRRLHDVGRSGWWYFIGLVPAIGSIILFVWMVTDSQPGANAWGPNPKSGEVADISSHLVD
ncbi:MAG: uncharacterized membrane protein YhaH (DUF805 family) [Neolewinella sp.]|jgi:uncharacterized membrane protein YhaH (DUF805 family)